MTVLAFITDLGLQAGVAQAAREAGAKLTMVTSLYKFIPELPKQPSLVVIDMEAQGISGSALVSQVKGFDKGIPVVTCASEKRSDLLERAKRAGADKALSHDRLREELAGIMTATVSKS